MTESSMQCAVCGDAIDTLRQRGECGDCLRPFHLNLRTDTDERSCGAAYVSGACGASTYCDPCGAQLEAESAKLGFGVARVR